MSKRKVMVTSTGCLEYAPDRYKELPIEKIRVKVIFDGKEYLEGLDLNPVEFYQKLETLKNPKNNLPHTAIPDYQTIYNQFEQAYKDGYDEIIIIVLSAYLGGTLNQIRLVSEEFADKIKFTIIDSKITCFGEGLLAVKAYELVEKGVPTEEIVKEINWAIKHQEFLGIDAKLDYLIYNGRLKGGKALIAKMAKICPVVHFTKEGELTSLCTVRTQRKALEKTCELLLDILKDRDPKDYLLWHVYTGPDVVEELKEIEKNYSIKCNHEDVIMSPVSGAHNGPWLAGYGVFFIRREDEPLE